MLQTDLSLFSLSSHTYHNHPNREFPYTLFKTRTIGIQKPAMSLKFFPKIRIWFGWLLGENDIPSNPRSSVPPTKKKASPQTKRRKKTRKDPVALYPFLVKSSKDTIQTHNSSPRAVSLDTHTATLDRSHGGAGGRAA